MLRDTCLRVSSILWGNWSSRSPNWTWAATISTFVYSNGGVSVCFGFHHVDFWLENLKKLKKPTIKYHHTSSFFTGTTYIVVKVDGGTPKRWWFVRGHDKPIHGELRQLLSRWYNFYHNQHQLQRWTVMPTASCYGVAPAWAMRNELVACGVPGL